MRIAVWNTAFLGDALLTLPLIHTLAATFPGAEIDFFTRRGLGAFFRSQPVLHAVHEMEKKRAAVFFRQAREVRQARYDIWVNAHRSPRSALLARASGAPVRVGFATGLLSRLAHTRTVPYFRESMDELERLLELARPFDPPAFHAWPDIHVPEEADRRAADFFRQLPPGGPPGPVVGLHPGSVWGTKRWPASSYARLAVLALDAGCRVIVFAGSGEEDTAAELLSMSGRLGDPRLVSLAGRLDLSDLAAHFARLDCYVTNDSGPMHLAWALHTPVTALFGPTTRALGFFPRGEKTSVLEMDLPCRPCGLHGPQACPKGHHDCMRLITPEMVWEDVRQKIGL